MDKIKELIKRHKGLAIIGSLALILLIVLFAIFARMIFTSEDSVYGDRLKGIVNISKATTNEIKTEIEAFEEVEKISIRTQGKIVYITIKYNENTSKEKMIEIAEKTIAHYSEEVVGYYDFEYLLSKEIHSKNEDGEEITENYTVAGTKHPDNEKISWTKN